MLLEIFDPNEREWVAINEVNRLELLHEGISEDLVILTIDDYNMDPSLLVE